MDDLIYLRYIGGRKFTLSVLIVLLATVLCWFAKISDSTYSTIVAAVVLGYIAGNVVQKIDTQVKP